ncbi:hypothetical protein M5K25_003779 [Dendrobium thyrsiflorum]|uniref:Uncharacterized protein n=1 Tax=Dendrobium thyrsiflorum TaxID=117978 RepID=A0ABD0VSE9_DENTH
MVVKPVMLYGVECWHLKEKYNIKLSAAEMRMLRWISGFTLRDKIRNEHIREKIEMIYKIIAHMAANDRAIITEGNCGSPRSIKVFLGECNVDEFYA